MSKKTLLMGVLIGIILGFILVNGFSKVIGEGEKEYEPKYSRFQLFQATVNLQNDLSSKIQPMPLVFLLDSTTGDVKYYYMGVTKQEVMIGEWMRTKYKTQMAAGELFPIPTPK